MHRTVNNPSYLFSRIPVSYYHHTLSVLCEKTVMVGHLVYLITGNTCYAMRSSDYDEQKSFTPDTTISVANGNNGCRAADGSILTMENGDVMIYDIKKMHLSHRYRYTYYLDIFSILVFCFTHVWSPVFQIGCCIQSGMCPSRATITGAMITVKLLKT